MDTTLDAPADPTRPADPSPNQGLGHDAQVSTPEDAARRPPPRVRGLRQPPTRVRGLGRDLGFLVGTFFVSLAGFIVCLLLFVVGISTFWVVVGLFVLVGCLVAAGGFADVHRSLLHFVGRDLPRPFYPTSRPGVWGRLRRLRDVQSWRDLLHVVVAITLSLATFPITVTWLFAGPGGLTYGLWSKFLPEDNQGIGYLLGYPGRAVDVAVNTVAGAVFVLTLPAVLHGLVSLHAAVARGLLVDENAALRRQVSELATSRAAAGDAEVHTLRRLERDLHDGPQQRLVRLGMDLSAAQRRLDTDPDQARVLLGEALQQSQDALAEIRSLSRGIAPPILTEQGLRAAVTALVARGSVLTTVDVAVVPLSDAAQNAVYFVVAESLTNLEKHSRATTASVEVRRVGGVAVVTVTDDGVGGASLARGHGLAGLADRLAGVDGALVVDSPAGGPTQVTATLPVHGP